MADEVIDLTASPPSPSPPPPPKTARILKFKASTSSKKIQFKIKKSPQPTQNPSSSHINQQVVPRVPRGPSSQIYNFSQIINNLQSTMQGNQAQGQAQLVAVYKPNMAAPNTFLFPLGPKLRETWTLEEHEQFLKGLVTFGGCWTKIASDFVVNKTAEQIERYATTFFRHLTSICLYSLRKKKSSSTTSFTTLDSNPMIMMKEKHVGPPPTLMLFPDNIGGQFSSSTLSVNVVAPNMATTEGEVDLELRLA